MANRPYRIFHTGYGTGIIIPQMTAEQMALLDRLFESAAAIPEAQRPAWLAANCSDPEVRAELESLLPHAGPDGGFTAALDSAAEFARQTPIEAGHLIGPYRVVGVLGAGGMGTVYEAIRDGDQFRQRVAIKVLRISARSEAALRRFLLERQILAELEHPNIARLFDGGAAADGSPYIVMERIDGQPLIAFADANKLSIRQRLELFRQVANAVQYAHQKLIVHRDLKPGNILVGSDGVPKLLDFGIAKLLDDQAASVEALTATGFQLMTPDYASPEQVQGKPVTAASDVYSLGAVLYELLSGARPHGLKSYHPAEITEQVCLREIPPPSTTGGPALRGDLDTIVLKAMHKVPERRYNSAEQFSEDLRRYLEGMPVLARPDTAGYRLRKFVRRHWVGVGATAAVIAALSGGVAVSLYQARLARQRFDQVRTLANRFLFDFHGEIANLSGSTKAQQMVVNTAVEYLDKLSRTAGSDRTLLKDMAEAYGKLAKVQGGGPTSSAARFRDALESQRRSVEFYRQVTADDPVMAVGLAGSLLDQAIIEQRLSQTAAGLEHSREAAGILEGLAASGKPQASVLDECARAYAYLSRSLRAIGKMDEALQTNHRSQTYLGRLMETDKTPRQRYRLAIAQQDEGTLHTDTGDPEKGAALLARVVQEFEELSAAEPRNRLYQRVLGASMGVLAEAHYSIEVVSVGDARKSAAVHQKRRALCRHLFDSDPADGAARIDLAIAESESANALIELDPPQAVTLAESGLAHWDLQIRAAPGDQFSIPRRARAAVRLARALLRVGRTQPAIARAREAAVIFRQLLAQQPDEKFYQESAVFAFAASGATLAAGQQEAEARAAFEEAAALGNRLLTDRPPLSSAVAATYAFDSFGDYWNSRSDRVQARTWWERSRQAWAVRPEKTAAVEERRQRAEARLRAVEP